MTDVQYTLQYIFTRLFCVLVKNATGMLQFTQEKQKDDNTAKRTQFDAEKRLPIFLFFRTLTLKFLDEIWHRATHNKMEK